MGLYTERVLPRVMDLVMRGDELAVIRARVASGLAGDVLEVGFGSGLNVAHYPAAVTKVLAVDPATVGRQLAARRVAASLVPITFVGLDGQSLPLADESVDHVLTTWTLCTIPDVEQALLEIKRVLRPGGSLHFIEHGRVARRQRGTPPGSAHARPAADRGRVPPQPSPSTRLIAGSGL